MASEYWMALLLHDSLRRLRRLGQTMVVCFDSPSEPLFEPRFTHIEQDEREIGCRAVDLLLAQIEGQTTPSQSIVPHRLVTADS